RRAWSTAIFSLATGLSRILGLIREIVAAYYCGAAGQINAFTVAFQVPNLVRSLVADAALSSAFVPVFSELLEKGERKRAWRVASTLFWLMLLGLGALTALLIVLAPLIIAPFGNPGGDKELAIGLARVLFPIVALLGVSGVIVGILNSYEHFTAPALSPVFWNLAIIAGLVLGVPNANGIDAQLYVYAFSILIGTVIQVLLPVPWLRGLDGRLQLVLDWRDPAVRNVFKLLIPAGVVTAVLAEPITRVIYQHGKWTPGQTPVTAACVAAFSGGLVFNGWMLMLNRAFFSLQENWLPTLVALTNLGLNALLDAV